jgi:hypothetical protein
MTSIWEVLTNSTVLYAFPHTILAALTTAGMVIIAVSAHHLVRRRQVEGLRARDADRAGRDARRRDRHRDRRPLPGRPNGGPAADEDGLVLEGFDFGVGMLLRSLGRTAGERRAIMHSIGPVWDGNEVWVIVAGGATFAAFPEWYATLFSGFYVALS